MGHGSFAFPSREHAAPAHVPGECRQRVAAQCKRRQGRPVVRLGCVSQALFIKANKHSYSGSNIAVLVACVLSLLLGAFMMVAGVTDSIKVPSSGSVPAHCC